MSTRKGRTQKTSRTSMRINNPLIIKSRDKTLSPGSRHYTECAGAISRNAQLHFSHHRINFTASVFDLFLFSIRVQCCESRLKPVRETKLVIPKCPEVVYWLVLSRWKILFERLGMNWSTGAGCQLEGQVLSPRPVKWRHLTWPYGKRRHKMYG